MKANTIGQILSRNCLQKHVVEGNIEVRIHVTGRQERRRKQLLDDIQETIEYWKLKEEALYRTLRRTSFGRGYGPDAKQATQRMKVE